MTYRVIDYCVCPSCMFDLVEEGAGFRCTGCRRHYELRNGIPILLPMYDDAVRDEYRESYEQLARDDLESPIEAHREHRHRAFRVFVGNLSGLRVLDVGSSTGTYLRDLDAGFRVAFDIALPYLEAIPDNGAVARVCGDAEHLPFKPGFFDAVLVSDVLEHLLEPRAFVRRLLAICRPDTRVFVHVPWEERLESYRDSNYRFTHLRSFDNFTFSDLWRDFSIRRRRSSVPNMQYPLSFQLADRLPISVFNRLRLRYFHHSGIADQEFTRRRRRIAALPKWERLWLRFYEPTFRMHELRPERRKRVSESAEDVARTRRRGAERIMMLVPHEPAKDPRIEWVSGLCAEFSRTDVIAATWTTAEQARVWEGRVYLERVNIHETASTGSIALGTALSAASLLGATTRYVSREGRLPATRNPLRRLEHQVGAIGRAVSAAGWLNLIVSALRRRARATSIIPRLVVCHDLYALIPAAALKKLYGCAIIYDAHEYWPEADLFAQRWEQRLMQRIERRYIRRADVVITVTPQLADQLRRTYGVADVRVVPNAEPRRSTPRVGSSEGELPVKFLLQGNVAPNRGIDTLLDQWSSLDEEHAVLYVRAPENPYLSLLRERFAASIESGRVVVLPAVSEHELVEAAGFADVGVIPYGLETLNHVFACPNKLSQYMQAGLAVLATPMRFVADVLTRYDCGLVYDPNSAASLRAAVAEFVDRPDRLGAMRRNAAEAAAADFNWEVQSRPYREAIADLLARA